MSGRQIRSNKTIYGKLLAIFLVILPGYSAAATCLWINGFCYSNDCPKYPDPDSALDVMTEDAWLFHTTNSGTCVYHNGAYGTPSSYQITNQTCENRPYSDLPSRCTRVVSFYYSDGAFCDSVVEHAAVWSCEEEQKQYIIKLEPSNGASESETILSSIEPPDKSTNLVAKVYDQNDQLVPNVGVQLTLEAKKDSGGHHHGDDKVVARTGTMQGQQVLTGNTGPNGLQFSYKAPSVAGDYKIKASCTDGKNCTPEGPDMVWVGVKNLVPIPNATDPSGYQLYALIGRDGFHPNNHYLTSDALTRLIILAGRYRDKFPNNPALHLNDASLGRGGMFDINFAPYTDKKGVYHSRTPGGVPGSWWVAPHSEHKRGTVIDIRANGGDGSIPVDEEHFEAFEDIAQRLGTDAEIHSPDTSNQHYHVRLMGAAE